MAQRDFEQDTTVSPVTSAVIKYTRADGTEGSAGVSYRPISQTTGYYTTISFRDAATGEVRTSDVLTRRISDVSSVLAARNPSLCKSYLDNGITPNLGASSFARTITTVTTRLGLDGPIPVKEVVDEYLSEFDFAGGLGIQSYVIDGQGVVLSNALVHTTSTITEYEVNEFAGISKTKTTRYLAWGTTSEGKDLASAVSTQARSVEEIKALITTMRAFICDGTTVQTALGRDYGLQTRPSEQDEERQRLERTRRVDDVTIDIPIPDPNETWEDIDFDLGRDDDGFTLPDVDDPVIVDFDDWDLPTIDPPTDPLPGDRWNDADTDTPRIWDGDDWVVVTPEPPENPEPGDKWVDADDQISYVWKDDRWTPYTFRPVNLTPDDTGRVTFDPATDQLEIWDDTEWVPYRDNEPDPQNVGIGDRYIQPDTGIEVQWDGEDWNPTGNTWPPYTFDPPEDPDAGDRWINRQTTRIETWTGEEWSDLPPFRPLNPAPGDTWVDPLTQIPEVWDSSDWNVYSPVEPVSPALNDAWVNPETGIQRRWDGQEWAETGVVFGSTVPTELSASGGTAVRVAVVELPFANDDTLAAQRLPGNVWRQWVVPGGAQAQATALGQLENALRFGTSYGANIVVEPWHMPSEPLAPFTVRAGGLEVQYLADGPSWEFDGELFVASCDGILCGATGRIPGQRAVPWVAVKLNVNSLPTVGEVTIDPAARPANTIPVPAGFRASRPGGIWNILPTNGVDTFEQSGTPLRVFPPFSVIESDRLTVETLLEEGEVEQTLEPFAEGIEQLAPRALLEDDEPEPISEGLQTFAPRAVLEDIEPEPVAEGVDQLAPRTLLEGTEATVDPEITSEGLQTLAVRTIFEGNESTLDAQLTFSSITLLLSFNEGEGAQVFQDSGPNQIPVSVVGVQTPEDIRTTVDDKKYGASALRSVSVGRYVVATSASVNLGFGAGDFTVAFELKPLSIPVVFNNFGSQVEQVRTILQLGGLQLQLTTFEIGGGSNWRLVVPGIGGVPLGSANNDINTWRHYAISKKGTSLRVFRDGVQIGSTVTTDLNLAAAQILLGPSGAPDPDQLYRSSWLMDEFLAVNGVALYTSNFTPPTGPVLPLDPGTDPNFSSVSLLLPFDGANGSTTFTDRSNNGLSVTAVGNARISTNQSRWGGSSLELDGTGDYLRVVSDADLDLTGDFTVEMWIRPTTTPTAVGFVVRPNSLNISPIRIDATSGQLRVTVSPNGSSLTTILTGGTFAVNSWQHLAVTRSGNTWRSFIDGILQQTATNTITPFTSTDSMLIGTRVATSNFYSGFIDDLRITKGIARYTSNFTPPTGSFPTS